MDNKSEIQKQLKVRLQRILKIKERVTRNALEIDSGDVSPFFLSLFGKEITLYGKVTQSISTTLGMSFYEQVSKILAESVGYEVELQYKLEGQVSEAVSKYLDTLLEDNSYKANRTAEIAKIKELTTPGTRATNPDSTVDVFIKTPDGIEYYIDITTTKPNKKEFRTLKRKLLKWTAMRLSINPDADVRAYVAIPYNPEAVKDTSSTTYTRHSSYYDRSDLLVGNELWLLVSNNTFNIIDMEEVFTELNEEVSQEITAILKEHS